MKIWKKSLALGIIICIFLSTVVFGANRVVCDVEVLSNNSAKISLRWSEDAPVNIRITSWQLVDEDTLKISYDYGSNIPAGWNEKTISSPEYHFPMRIILEEQGSEGDLLNDLPGDYEAKSSILNLYSRNIINGYPDGSFKPNKQVSRTEFAKMVTLTAKYELLLNEESDFGDVSNDFWGRKYIMTLADKGILKGRPGGIFDPNGQITMGEVLAVLNRSFMVYQQENTYPYALEAHWSNNDFLKAVEYGLVRKGDAFYTTYNANVKATRQECAIILSRVLESIYETK